VLAFHVVLFAVGALDAGLDVVGCDVVLACDVEVELLGCLGDDVADFSVVEVVVFV